MVIKLYTTTSEKNKISKHLTGEFTLSGTLRNETSVVNPVILFESNDLTGFNYCYIPEFERYYFITDIVSVRNGLLRVSLSVDVLMSYRDIIVNMPVILTTSEEKGANNYLSGSDWIAKVKDTTTIKNFPNGLLESGEFILITAGG